MSVRAIQWALEQATGRAAEKLVLIVLANYADEHGHCYPSMARIRDETRLDRKTVIAAIKTLRADGFIADTGERRGRTGQVVVHRLSLFKESQKRDRKRVPKTEQSQKRNSTVFPVKESQKRDRKESQKRDTEPLEEPLRNRQIDKRARTGDGFGEFWAAYPRKRAKGAAMRAYAKALERAPPDEILAGAERYAAERRGEDPRFTAHPATWLNADRWKDEPDSEHTRTIDADRIDAIVSGRDPDDRNEVGGDIRPALEQRRNAGTN